jgi:hypothetical protein
MNRLISGLILSVLFAPPAAAQWLYQGEESAFGSSGTHMAVTAKGRYGLSVRCMNSKLELVCVTPDTSFDEGAYKLANTIGMKLRVRVDDAPVVDLDAELTDADGKAIILAGLEPELGAVLSDAKKRVAVVLNLMGDNYHENTFGVRGSTKAIGKVLAACSEATN